MEDWREFNRVIDELKNTPEENATERESNMGTVGGFLFSSLIEDETHAVRLLESKFRRLNLEFGNHNSIKVPQQFTPLVRSLLAKAPGNNNLTLNDRRGRSWEGLRVGGNDNDGYTFDFVDHNNWTIVLKEMYIESDDQMELWLLKDRYFGTLQVIAVVPRKPDQRPTIPAPAAEEEEGGGEGDQADDDDDEEGGGGEGDEDNDEEGDQADEEDDDEGGGEGEGDEDNDEEGDQADDDDA